MSHAYFLAAAPFAEPHSNLRVVEGVPAVAKPVDAGAAPDARWIVVDGVGTKQGRTASRSEAVRLMSRLGMREHSVMPLTVVDSNGNPTGDRLA